MGLCIAALQAAVEYGALNGTMLKLRVLGHQAAHWSHQHWPWVLGVFVFLMVLHRLFRPR